MSQDTTGRLCNLEELITNDGEKMVNIIIPKIQRAYAQGRKREENIREQFVSRILEALSKGEDMELNFVYGSKTEGESGISFELLDGQQRITTLFLLHWYFSMVEGCGSMPEVLKHLSYETRTTSTDFIKKLVDSKIDVSTKKPSEGICSRQWYTIAYDKDSTVEGMLTMLDTIHKLYNDMGRPSGMLANLAKIRFYELDLKDFGLTEEIYIKMNARGLQLTPFENFKADVVKYMKDNANSKYKEEVKMDIIGRPQVPYYLCFSQKLDSKWLNLFWNKTDEDNNVYCDKFFRFFYRYFANKYFLEVKRDNKPEDFRPKRDDGWDFLWTKSREQSSTKLKTYYGFSAYKNILDATPEYLYRIEKVLDVLCQDDIATLLATAKVTPWDNNTARYFFEDEYKLQDSILFAAVSEYIEVSDTKIDVENLRKWIRVVMNTSENMLFQNVDDMIRIVRHFVNIIHLPDATQDIYKVLATLVDKSYPRALREEIRKAEIIANNPTESWEAAFIEAESHPFFCGAIGYFLFADVPATAEQFKHRTSIVSQMFDGKGIVEPLRENHKLIMAMIRQLSSTSKMGVNDNGWVNFSITEKYDTQNHLKFLMLDKHAIGELLCRLGDMATFEDAITFIEESNKRDIVFEYEGSDDKKGKITRAFRRLANDMKLYDFIANSEDSSHIMEFTFLDYRHYAINKKRSWYHKFFIESERNLIVPKLVNENGFDIIEQNQKDSLARYGDFFGYNVELEKVLENSQKVLVKFVRGTDVEIYLYHPSNDLMETKFGRTRNYDEDWESVGAVPYSTVDDYDMIASKILEIEQKCLEFNN